MNEKTASNGSDVPTPETIHLGSFGKDVNAVVIGASGAIGGAFVDHLAASDAVASVLAFARRDFSFQYDKVTSGRIDLENEHSIAEAARQADALAGTLDLVIVATGVLHDGGIEPEKTWRSLDRASLIRAYEVNAVGPALVAKHFLPLLTRKRKAAFAALSARVGSVSDNGYGGWHGYRASKAALNMLIRNFAIELGRRNPTAICVGLHPGTVDSGLSKPFQGNVPKGKLFSPAFSAGRLLQVVDDLDATATGRLFAWDGREIAP